MHKSLKSQYGYIFAAILLLTASTAGANMIVNGSFEQDVVTAKQKWNIYTSISGWSLGYGPSIEVQAGVNGWLAADGQQYVELDSDINGPGGGHYPGEAANSGIFQDINTIAGQHYELTFAFSPRPGVADNKLRILWDGQLVDTLSANGQGLSNTNWQYYSYSLTASDAVSRIEFGDISKADTYGTFIDDVCLVSLNNVPEPGALSMMIIGLIPLRFRRRSSH